MQCCIMVHERMTQGKCELLVDWWQSGWWHRGVFSVSVTSIFLWSLAEGDVVLTNQVIQ